LLRVIAALVAAIQLKASSARIGWLDAGNKSQHDKAPAQASRWPSPTRLAAIDGSG
jgi:hypothetical protein